MPHRIQWPDLPDRLHTHLEQVFGHRVTAVHSPPGGFGRQLAAALTLEDGSRVFAKAGPESHAEAILAEARVLQALPPHAPAPTPIHLEQAYGWAVLVTEHFSGGHPDLTPGSPAVATVLEQLSTLAAAPADPRFRAAVGTRATQTVRLHGWRDLDPADLDPWSRANLDRLRELELAWPDHAVGDHIVHADLRADNMVTDRVRGLIFVDWPHATVGPAWVDLASLAPQFVLAGHRPEDVANLLATHPLTQNYAVGVDAFLAALTGHWERGSRRTGPHTPPGLAAYQSRAAAAGRALLAARFL